ncbi:MULTISPECIES: TIGR04255 family protein [unclassified Streptomyces]|uniref:TIGR04255 family protein n=1 Tax=unclassified Streptomyces TaxID=2593676 RepID=UPI002ED1C38B|nr:TIGR04255 family protein [Streptomyces sp. NBC_00891]WSY06034.1 TIGR04255 family protein [Streptomyces sp. NBC_00890]WSZ07658.1 TIGR04255 family protein [Streptomyces sp. NBC_00869]WSZ24843.1 TIGR04255 family protein [Streptomyces sp. NBC_00870]
MGAQQLSQPFGDEPYDEVRLPGAPLVRVLSQLRFERLSVLDGPNAAGTFASALSDSYPYLDTSAELNVVIGGGQVMQMPQPTSQTVWRLRSADKTRTVTLTNGSLSLETASYEGRDKFCMELHRVTEALQNVVRVPAINRIGVRYTNQVTGPPLENLAKYFRQEVTGISTVPLGKAELQHCLTQASFITGEGTGLVSQWGMMPSNSGFDPALPVLAEPSYVLDLDAYRQASAIDANPSRIQSTALTLAEHAYRYLRWAVTVEFLRQYGGDV